MKPFTYVTTLLVWLRATVDAKDEKDDTDFTNKYDYRDWYSVDSSYSPYEFDPALWGLFMRNEVAHGSTTFKGPNISEPFAGEGTDSVDWTVSVSLATNISLDYSADKEVYNSSAFVSGGVLSLAPSKDLWDPDSDETFYADPSWKICLYFPIVTSVWATASRQKALHEDTCGGDYYPEECLKAIKEKMSGILAFDDDEEYPETCKPFYEHDWPEECPERANLDAAPGFNHSVFQLGERGTRAKEGVPMFAPWDLSSASKSLNSDPPDDMDQLPEGKFTPSYANGSAVFQWASTWGDPGNMTSLEEIGYITPLFVAFAMNSTYIGNDTKKNATIDRVGVEFVCAQADKTTGDYLEEAPESAAARAGVAAWTLGLAAVIMVLL